MFLSLVIPPFFPLLNIFVELLDFLFVFLRDLVLPDAVIGSAQLLGKC